MLVNGPGASQPIWCKRSVRVRERESERACEQACSDCVLCMCIASPPNQVETREKGITEKKRDRKEEENIEENIEEKKDDGEKRKEK